MGWLWVWIIVVSCFVGTSAASAQQPGDCQPAALAAAFIQAFGDVMTRTDRSLPDTSFPYVLPDDRYSIDEDWSALIGMSSGSVLPSAQTGGAPQFWIFHVATEAQASISPPPTIQIPQVRLTATVTSRLARGARLRSGPSTDYDLAGVALPRQVLNVVASARIDGFDWFNVGDGSAWIRSDLVSVNNPEALESQRMALNWTVDVPSYADVERRERCPLPSALVIQTEPGRFITYNFNGLTLLQSGTAVITYDNFRPAGESSPRFFFTNVQGTLETVMASAPLRVIDPGLTFAVEFDATGVPRYVSSFTQDEQELGSAAWVFACNAANLYDQAVSDATGAPLLWYRPTCGSSVTFERLHGGWSEALAVLQAGKAFLRDQYLRAN